MAISAQFTADFSQFTTAAEEAKTALGGVQTAAEGIDLNAQAEQAGRAIVDLGRTVTTFASDYIKAFAEEEAATARLTAALQGQGLLTTETIANYAAMAEQFQATTRYSDDAITAAQTALTTIGKLGPEQMAPAIQAAVNLAARLGIGLPEAAQKMAVVIGSDGAKLGTLKKYLTDVELKGKDASEIIAIFNSKFGGAAAADMETTEGKLAALNNKFDDFKGKVGGALAEALTPFLEAFTSLSPKVQTLILGVGGLVLALTPVAIAFGTLVTAIGPLIPLIATVIPAALASLAVLMGPAGLVVGAIVAVYVAFKNWSAIVDIARSVYEGVKLWLVDKFVAIAAGVKGVIDTIIGYFRMLFMAAIGGSYVPDMIDGIASEFAKLDRVMLRPALEAASGVTGAMSGLSGPSLVATGGGGAVTNTFYVNGTAEDVARTISAEIMRSMKAGAKVSAS
jgi:hypothetical protein